MRLPILLHPCCIPYNNIFKESGNWDIFVFFFFLSIKIPLQLFIYLKAKLKVCEKFLSEGEKKQILQVSWMQ